MNDLLLEEIKKLQEEYKVILNRAVENIFVKETHVILDEINVFWHRNKKIVHCALEYLSKPYETYMFTAATVLDIGDNEHYPFLCIGKYHIWDDPIYGYINTVNDNFDDAFILKMKGIVLDTIKDNIKILDALSDKIFILPVRMLSEVEAETIHESAQKMFFSMFKSPPRSMKEYQEKYVTIEDICTGLRDDVKPNITFNGESCSEELTTRFTEYKESAVLPVPLDKTDAMVFWFTLYGYLSQAIDVMLVCLAYRLVPYLRFNETFKYLNVLHSTLSENSEFDILLFKCTVSYILRKSFDYEKYSGYEIGEFIKSLRDNNFEQNVFCQLGEKGINLLNPNVKDMVGIIETQMANCFKSNK